MSNLHITKVSMTLDLKVPANDIEKHLPASPYVVGEQIAEQVMDYVNKNKIGYFPALDYFRERDEVLDKDLINAADNITWLVSNMVREEITRKLRGVFSNVKIESIHAHAFTMPSIRRNSNNIEHKLASHYTPDHFKVALTLSSIRNHDDSETADLTAKKMVHKWLKDEFTSFNVTSTNIVNQEED